LLPIVVSSSSCILLFTQPTSTTLFPVLSKLTSSVLSFEDLTDNSIVSGKFVIINGQHSVGKSLKMQSTRLLDKIVKPFLRWNCFIVWSKDKK
jgi:hypothetical protein